MASVLSRRLGKRSLLGARVLGPSASDGPSGVGPPLEPQVELLEGAAPQPFLAIKDPACPEQPKEVLKAPCTSGLQRVVFQPGQKVFVWYGGQECAALVEQHSWAEDKVTVWLLDQRSQICCKAEEVWLAELQGPLPQAPPLEHRAQAPAYRPVSRNIDVPKRKSDAVEMDEMMAAMVLTSLSCSPVVQSPPGAEANFAGEHAGPDGFWERRRPLANTSCLEQLFASVASLAREFLEPFPQAPRPGRKPPDSMLLIFLLVSALGAGFLVHCEGDGGTRPSYSGH